MPAQARITLLFRFTNLQLLIKAKQYEKSKTTKNIEDESEKV